MLKPNLKEAMARSNEKKKIEILEYVEDNNLKDIAKGLKYHVKTYGCQMNEHDSENIKAMLESLGYEETTIMEEADFILLNTCAIRENAHNKVFGFLGRIKNIKEERPNVIAGICGCMAQEEVVVDEILSKYNYIDLIFGTHNLYHLPKLLSDILIKKENQVEVFSYEGDIVENIPVKRDSKIKAWVNIMYGCDKFCTYCIVPYTRGKQRSRRKDDIIKEVTDLKENGYKEVTLLGQNVNAYGKDLKEDYRMENLLEDVAKTGIERVRFVTSHPWDFTDSMVDIIAKYDNIMPYIHLPLQSGSNRVLKLMGRRYTKEEYLKLFHNLKNKVKNVSITTDIIVGFPNETEEDFKETLSVVEECKYDSAYTFIFSPRVGTPAAKMQDNIPLKEKEERLQRLNEKINEYALEANKKYQNQIVKVLIEGVSEKDDTKLMGYTETMKLVNVKAPKEKIGSIIDVKITDVKTWSLDGEIYE